MNVDELAEAVIAQLQTAEHLDVFDGVVTAVPDGDGKARPYAAAYFGPGRLYALALCDTQDVLDWSFQVTAAGGDPTRARRAAQRVRDSLSGARLRVSGAEVFITEDPDYQPGPAREDRDQKPSRWFTPMQFRASVTNT